MNDAELEQQAILETVRVIPYQIQWPEQFRSECERLAAVAPELLAVEHIGSTAVAGLSAKPIIDIMAAVASMDVADQVVHRLCRDGYITSDGFNRSLGDRRWLMRHAGGHRTHHLHLVSIGSQHWVDSLRFRDALRRDDQLARAYAQLKERLAAQLGGDRDAYGDAKTAFITTALSNPD